MLLICTLSFALGYMVIVTIPIATGIYAKAFNAGAVLAMIASTMISEGVKESGRTSVQMVVLGFALAAMLSIVR